MTNKDKIKMKIIKKENMKTVKVNRKSKKQPKNKIIEMFI
jgi:hypothetical protein